MGKHEKARELFNEIKPRVEEMGLVWATNSVYIGIADTYEDNDPEMARKHYELALDQVERGRETVGGAELRTGYMGGTNRWYYEEIARYYISVARRTGDTRWSADAFYTMERAKARGLLDLLASSVASETSDAENAVLDSLYRLDPEAAGSGARKRQLENRYADLRAQGNRDVLGDLARETDIATVADVQAAMPEGSVLLEYAMGDTTSFLWVIDRDGVDVYDLPNRREITRAVRRVRSRIEASREYGLEESGPAARERILLRECRRLYDTLVGPAAERVADAETVIIVPDGALFELPFEVLLTGDFPVDAEWRDLPFLARTIVPTYVPSSTILLERGSASSKDYDLTLLAVGHPDYSLFDEEVIELPNTREEVLGISSSLRDDDKLVLLDKEANEAGVKTALGANSVRIVHMATHGNVNPLEPTRSNIVLCPDPEGREDGYLHTLEVLSLNVDAALVVLSACQSGRGRIDRGEGVVGLSRAFLATGTDALVVSLWPVADDATSEFMARFYEPMLNKKKTAREALADARTAMLKDEKYSHPYYWSAFVFVGSHESPW